MNNRYLCYGTLSHVNSTVWDFYESTVTFSNCPVLYYCVEIQIGENLVILWTHTGLKSYLLNPILMFQNQNICFECLLVKVGRLKAFSHS